MKSVQNIGTITKAMELVAATKMRRSQELALNARPYAYTALQLLGILSRLKDVPMPALLTPRPIAKTAFMLVTSDKGLAGSFNGSVLRKFEQYARTQGIDAHDPKYAFIAVGQKAKSYLEHRGFRVSATFTRVGDFTRIREVAPIAEFLVSGYLHRDFDEVTLFSTNFITALHQEVLVRQILPVSLDEIKEGVEFLSPELSEAGKRPYATDALSFVAGQGQAKGYVIEPTPEEVLEELAPELLKIRLFSAILEANASEHSARRVAMKNASDNAQDLSEALTMVYNKSRQAAITNQIIEVTAGAQALS